MLKNKSEVTEVLKDNRRIVMLTRRVKDSEVIVVLDNCMSAKSMCRV